MFNIYTIILSIRSIISKETFSARTIKFDITNILQSDIMEVTPNDIKKSADDRKAPPINTPVTPEAIRDINAKSSSLHRLVPYRYDSKSAKTIKELSTLFQEKKKTSSINI